MADAEDLELQPLDVDGVRAVAVGTVVWAVLAVVAFLLRDRLEVAGNGWWFWVCVAGAGLGLLGLPYVMRRARAYRSAGSDSAAGSDSGSISGSDSAGSDGTTASNS